MDPPPRDTVERAALDLTMYALPEEVIHFRMHNKVAARVETYTRFPNLRALSFTEISLPAAFPDPNLIGEGKIFPALEHIFLENMIVDYVGWSPLVTFLAHRLSSGSRLDTLVIVSSPHMCPDVMEGIRGMVRELRIENQSRRGPFQPICCT